MTLSTSLLDFMLNFFRRTNMRFCQECGSQLQEVAAYCNHCGTIQKINSIPVEINDRVVMVEQISEPTSQGVPHVGGVHHTAPPTSPKQPLSKKKKIFLYSGLLAIILLIGLHFVLLNYFSPKRMIENFEQALIDGNAKTIANLLSSDDEKLKINEVEVKSFVKYYQEYPEEINTTVSDLKNQLQQIENSSQPTSHMNRLVFLKKEGQFLFYDQYKLVIPGVYIEISTNYQDTALYVDEQEVGKAEFDDFSQIYGPFIPGIHTVEAKLKTDYVDLSMDKEVIIDGSENVAVNVFLDGDEVVFNLGNFDGMATLFINGKEIDKDFVEDPTFGPILVDGSMSFSVEAELPWGTVKTEESPIDEQNINVSFINEDLKKSLMTTVHTFNSERVLVRTSADGSKLTTATEEIKNDLIFIAEYDKERSYALKVKHKSTAFDLDSFGLEYAPSEDVWYAYVSAKPLWESDYYNIEQGANGLKVETEAYDYVLMYDEVQGKWLVDSESYSAFFNEENVKEIEVENPIQVTSKWAN